MAYDLVCDEFDSSYASVEIVSVGDAREASLDNNVRPLLPSDLHALLAPSFYKALYNI